MPVAVVERGERGVVVRAASPEARAEQVVTGLRRREAEARCAGLVIADADPHVEARAFEEVARVVEQFTPRFVLDEPGRLELPTRGPSRYFGGDAAFAEAVLGAVHELGIDDARLGVADGRFAARLAAQAAAPGTARVIPTGASPAFLAPWPVTVLDAGNGALADLLARLGLRTLGAFAELPPTAVLGRFGPEGARAHRLAAGLDERVAPPAPPPPDLVEQVELDPPVVQVETAAFAARAIAERLLARLASLGLACTRVMIEAQTEHGERLARCWRHEGALTPAALVARVRWQLEGWLTARDELVALSRSASQARPPARSVGQAADLAVDDLATAGLILLRLVPDEVAPAAGRQLGIWGGDAAATERAERVLARVQGMLGHPAVVTAVPQGGRTPAERCAGCRGATPGSRRGRSRRCRHRARTRSRCRRGRARSPPRRRRVCSIRRCRPSCSTSPGGRSRCRAGVIRRACPPGSGAVPCPATAGRCARGRDRGRTTPAGGTRRARSRGAHWQLLVTGPDGDTVACLVAVAAGRAALAAIYD